MGRKIIILFCIAVFYTTVNYGLSSHISDSLKKRFRTEKNEVKKIDILINISIFYHEVSPDSTRFYAMSAMKMARKLNKPDKEILALSSLVNGFTYFHHIDSSRKYLREIREIMENSDDSIPVVLGMNAISIFYEDIGKLDSSMYFLLKANDIASQVKSYKAKAFANTALGQFYLRQENYEKALPFCLAGLKYQHLDDSTSMATIYTNVGNIYYWTGKFDSAKIYYHKAYVMQLPGIHGLPWVLL